jgi:integrase/recombinase XerD
LPIVLTQEEVLKFLASVRSIKHRTILTTCYAAGLRVSEAICLKVTDIDSERMLIRVQQGKGQKDRDVMLSPKLLEILRDWWRVDKPKGWLFPGDRVESHVGRHTVESVCQKAHRRCYIPKPITPHSLRHYPEFSAIRSKLTLAASNPLLMGLGVASVSRSTRHSQSNA